MLSYELHLISFASRKLNIHALRVYSGEVVLAVIDKTLGEQTVVLGGTGRATITDIAPGQRAIILMNFGLNHPGGPSMLWHAVDYTEEGKVDAEFLHGQVKLARPAARCDIYGPAMLAAGLIDFLPALGRRTGNLATRTMREIPQKSVPWRAAQTRFRQDEGVACVSALMSRVMCD